MTFSEQSTSSVTSYSWAKEVAYFVMSSNITTVPVTGIKYLSPQSSLHYKKTVWKVCNFHYLMSSATYFLTFYNTSSELNQMSLLVSESVPLIVRIWISFQLNLLLSLIAMLICCFLPSWFFLVLSISLNLRLVGMTACPSLRIGITGSWPVSYFVLLSPSPSSDDVLLRCFLIYSGSSPILNCFISLWISSC